MEDFFATIEPNEICILEKLKVLFHSGEKLVSLSDLKKSIGGNRIKALDRLIENLCSALIIVPCEPNKFMVCSLDRYMNN